MKRDPLHFTIAVSRDAQQASPHAHCAVLDPSRRFVLVCDKSTDRIYTFRLERSLRLAATFQFPAETGPPPPRVRYSVGVRDQVSLGTLRQPCDPR